jgi:hypothetical protein
MDTIIFNTIDQAKINLALSFENKAILQKFRFEQDASEQTAEDYFMELKKFLYLCANTKQTLAPSAEIDKIWHTFILFTKEYRNYCTDFLGKFIDHVPEVEQEEQVDTTSKENYLLNTLELYKIVFGDINNAVWKVSILNTYCNEDANCSNSSECSNCSSSCESCSSCSSRGSQPSCVFTGNCYSCTNSGYSCVGENPNDM